MKDKGKEYRNGWSTYMERLLPSGMYRVNVRNASGDIHDKVRCDDYQDARAYFRSFNAIARNA